MKILTAEYVAKFTPDMGAVPIHCGQHPEAKMEAFYDTQNRTLVVCCAQCEKILVEQPIP